MLSHQGKTVFLSGCFSSSSQCNALPLTTLYSQSLLPVVKARLHAEPSDQYCVKHSPSWVTPRSVLSDTKSPFCTLVGCCFFFNYMQVCELSVYIVCTHACLDSVHVLAHDSFSISKTENVKDFSKLKSINVFSDSVFLMHWCIY